MSDSRTDACAPRALGPESLTPRDFRMLAWDSELFGFPVASVFPEAVEAGRLPLVVDALRSAGVRLAYASVPSSQADAAQALLMAGALPVDRKIRYRKEAVDFTKACAGVESVLGNACTQELDGLALRSGAYSRFRSDPAIPEDIFAALYLAWMRRSVSGEIAADVLVVRDGETIAGMVTVGPTTSAGVAVIGLIAVREDRCRSGVGKALVQGVEAWGFARNAAAIEVCTQGRNTAACRLYEACGFEAVADDAIFHLWIDPSP